jgi:hypothetical protein
LDYLELYTGQYYDGSLVNKIGMSGLDSSGSGQGQVAGRCKHGS